MSLKDLQAADVSDVGAVEFVAGAASVALHAYLRALGVPEPVLAATVDRAMRAAAAEAEVSIALHVTAPGVDVDPSVRVLR